jgi:SAM-dependent methyltransferase
MRHRSLVAVLVHELFGVALPICQLPVLKSIRGLGLSDTELYARVLADRFYYRNTYLHREPVLDIADPGPQEPHALDFLLASEVFEHVRPPVERAFENALALLRAEGVLVMTVPYELQGETKEHFPDLSDFAAVTLRSGAALVNRTAAGELQLFSDLVFHGGRGSTLELRCFSESGLRKVLADAGFAYVRIHAEDYPEYGIVHQESWSLPIAARRRPPESNRALIRELIERNWDGWPKALRHEQDENRRLHDELAERTEWVRTVERRLMTEIEDRTQWAHHLEAQLADRTSWAQRLDQQVKTLEEHLRRILSSRWHRVGRLLGFTPRRFD